MLVRPFKCIENVDLTNLVSSHMDYADRLEEILTIVGLGRDAGTVSAAGVWEPARPMDPAAHVFPAVLLLLPHGCAWVMAVCPRPLGIVLLTLQPRVPVSAHSRAGTVSTLTKYRPQTRRRLASAGAVSASAVRAVGGTPLAARESASSKGLVEGHM